VLNMRDFHILPPSHGVYMLHLFLARSQAVTIGRLGLQRLPAGHYCYIGSARGAGGLRARVGRHLRGDGALHWHIDFLRAVAEVRDVSYTVTDTPLECVWSQALAQLPQAFIPILRFGSSDCRSGCEAHLVAFPAQADTTAVQRALRQLTSMSIVALHLC
jgi:Uri superfamily endonuclease